MLQLWDFSFLLFRVVLEAKDIVKVVSIFFDGLYNRGVPVVVNQEIKIKSQKSVKGGPDGADFLHTDKIGNGKKKELKIASSSEAPFMVKRGVKV